MVADDLHALTAGYALDALDPHEERAYEEHLSGCTSCREELASFRETAAALAYGAEAPAPGPELRGRILETARAERATVVPLRSRRRLVAWAGAAAAAAAIAVVVPLGLWANSLSDDLERERATSQLLASARPVPLDGADGRIFVDSVGRAALVVSGLPAAPRGKTYEIWVIESDRPAPAGLFEGGRDPDVVRLSERVPDGAVVAVTVEDDGGVAAPTGSPLFSATIS